MIKKVYILNKDFVIKEDLYQYKCHKPNDKSNLYRQKIIAVYPVKFESFYIEYTHEQFNKLYENGKENADKTILTMINNQINNGTKSNSPHSRCSHPFS